MWRSAAIVLMAGLPATGKSTLAQRIAEVLPGIVLDKDAVRAALFARSEIDYSVAQDDLCMEALLMAARYILERDRSKNLLIDLRPFARRYEVERWREAAAGFGVALKVLECACSDQIAQSRPACAVASGHHPAANRDYPMYLALKRSFEPIAMPKLVLDTERSVPECIEAALAYLTEPGYPGDLTLFVGTTLSQYLAYQRTPSTSATSSPLSTPTSARPAAATFSWTCSMPLPTGLAPQLPLAGRSAPLLGATSDGSPR